MARACRNLLAPQSDSWGHRMRILPGMDGARETRSLPWVPRVPLGLLGRSTDRGSQSLPHFSPFFFQVFFGEHLKFNVVRVAGARRLSLLQSSGRGGGWGLGVEGGVPCFSLPPSAHSTLTHIYSLLFQCSAHNKYGLFCTLGFCVVLDLFGFDSFFPLSGVDPVVSGMLGQRSARESYPSPTV